MTDTTPTDQRDPATQLAFEAAAASLLENDAWTDPNGQRQLHAGRTNFVIAKARAGGVPRGPKSVVN